MRRSPLGQGEFERILALLESLVRERQVVLVGGQAVVLWADFLNKRGLELPIVATSDIDFEGPRGAALRAGKLLGTKVRIPKRGDRTTLNGVVTFIDSTGEERDLDFIESPRGLSARDVRDTALEVRARDPASGREVAFWAMHPERSMESRIYNVIDLQRTDRISLDQLRVSVVCAREWSRALLGEKSLSAHERGRAVLRLNERIFRKCRSDRCFRAVYGRHDIDPFEAVLIDDRLPKEFRDKRYPQMVASLEQVRQPRR
jgi:hypothetical protein